LEIACGKKDELFPLYRMYIFYQYGNQNNKNNGFSQVIHL
jgi:hypothetical protein